VLDLSGRIAVLGLGRSGRAVVEWALARTAHTPDDVCVFVEHETPAMRDAVMEFAERGVRVELGVADFIDEDFAFVAASPGIAPHRPLLASALASGVPVVSELEIAYQVSKAPFIAITGTNGKTTTTALVTHLLRTAGIAAESAGNIGTPALEVARTIEPGGFVVAECSSFQLALARDFHPLVAVLLNVTPDHIDWHGSLDRYASDKARVFARQSAGDTAVVDVDDRGSADFLDEAAAGGAKVVTVSPSGRGLARVEGGMLVVEHDGEKVDLVRVDELLIAGTHNVANALAASVASLAVGASPASVREGLRTFAPIEHRLEPVGTIDGVRFVNDSKATNPDAVLKALTAFDGSPLIVLLGGRNKGNDFTELSRACAARCRLCVLFGESALQLEAAFRAAGAEHAVAVGMLDALDIGAAAAMPGDVVLLSPACASFDEFTGYEERGRVFTAGVAGLAGERG